MSPSMRQRIMDYAVANRHRAVWRKRLYALYYGASLTTIARMK